MYNIFINSDFIDEILQTVKVSAEEYCLMFEFDYNLFKKIYNNDLSVTLRDLINFAKTFQIDIQNLIITA